MTSATAPAPTDTSSTGAAPQRRGTDHSFTAGWVLLGIGLILTLGIFSAVAYRGSVLDANTSGVQRGTTPTTSTIP